MKGKTREGQRNKCHIDMGKDKGRTEKHYSYLREELKNITDFHKGKDKGRTEKQKPYQNRERQGKN